ncbi:sulfurtransferase TusA family protein [Synechococcus sp. CBW1004]|jgi:TusA-related sulfurtransferase|uniref:sulfurtransferase TusA family protein n=1 Tax=Synechococcus sp. CBW1004 TaxID=1353136 RepID=UPI0018CF88F9|nr:sulfurtransferase TusA family protein [Synechococcus sp. CBW1004]QPN62414.1 sulfurtransferase TusA family protein [Synechococcus sp. CBW1004]
MSLSPPAHLDLRGTPCPLNYIRTRLALEKLPAGAELEVWLDRGEPERLVSEGLRQEGHTVLLTPLEGDSAVRLTVRSTVTFPASDG